MAEQNKNLERVKPERNLNDLEMGTPDEFTRYQIHLPDDDEDFDEFDELEARIDKAERDRKGRPVRGKGIYGTS